MRETTNPTPVAYDPDMSLAGLLREKWEDNPSKVQWERKTSLGSQWLPVTVDQFVAEVRQAAKGLVASGVEPGDRVGIMSRTRYEWTLLDFAAWWVGAIPVPIYETSSQDQMEWIVGDAGVSLLFAENRSQAEMARALGDRTPLLREALVIDDGAIPELNVRGQGVDDDVVEQRSKATKGDDVATIIYTSGTTGRPKGVVLWHRNFVFLAKSGRIGFADVCDKPYSRTLLFMPLAHVFARFIEVLAVATNTVLAHSPDVKNLIADVGTFKPTYLLAVPRVFEKIYNSADAKAGHGAKLKLFRWAAKTAIAYSRALEQPGGPSAALKAQHQLADRLVLAKVSHLLGGRLEYAVSGGAPLGERLGHFYRGMGVNILEGYGLTETTAPLSCNLPDRTKIGTVGVAFPQTSIRIGDD
ncbi:MAG: AMP-binding protein, partial [Actinomycetes bacterium]|nr:AMP-binding protein [Actinomycetes bacterium]MDX5379947.1 AMP-binding protein [Actinomycetes bacterium]MDX5398455.1 AMP-binding protein [Actinomycetes bacterium]MDX5449658.1 AMP-binding protein [Actinomycetes bacterium]